ncbi:MAG: UDP-2,3-diacylglucosamine diphosphatase LpxI [Candidatus Xiphinematobacter sp.]|nr:MAG: UDP-2,3-diacylglucosamine diphosphatase LpxI [Candidatus Xiphinematobacter sp.]
MYPPENLLLIAGSGEYPFLVVHSARAAGVRRIVLVAFEGETSPELSRWVDEMYTVQVGRLSHLLSVARKSGADYAMAVGQIAPKNLFDLRLDLQALLLLARLHKRNAETLFGAVADELAHVGVELLPATTFLDHHLAGEGLLAGPKVTFSAMEDLLFGYQIAKEISRLDIGQTVVVRKGTVLAVEAFEGTNASILRGGRLGRESATIVKVAKPNQDMRFDVPTIGLTTLECASSARIRSIGIEARCTLLLEKDRLIEYANLHSLSIYGLKTS